MLGRSLSTCDDGLSLGVLLRKRFDGPEVGISVGLSLMRTGNQLLGSELGAVSEAELLGLRLSNTKLGREDGCNDAETIFSLGALVGTILGCPTRAVDG